ncbi:MAG: ATP phosphoribosyltransferase regulatory subunit [Mariprofundaceae bacterium]|nr:ATP phosphoribosyltransferase regulatory subunit [Mariprofundaceae bacterium]
MRVISSPVLGLNDIFGAQARELRALQRRLLDLFSTHGFEEVIPPLLERPEVLLAGAGRFLMNNTLVFSDPAAEGQLAVRSDITPQIARIAASRLQHETHLSLCYSGAVVQARPDVLDGRRQQWQTGIEVLGDGSLACDLNVIHLAGLSMIAGGFSHPTVQIGHVGIVRALCADSVIPLADWIEILGRRSPDDVLHQLANDQLSECAGQALVDLASMQADSEWLAKEQHNFGLEFASAAAALLHVEEKTSVLLNDDVSIIIDAALMPHFLYHTGLIFSGYTPQAPSAVLRGGRYDDMMAAHGRPMPAIGFSFDLTRWLINP